MKKVLFPLVLVVFASLAWWFLPGSALGAVPGAVEGPSEGNSLAVVAGRFLLPDGSPAAAVTVGIFGWEGSQEDVLEFGLPESFELPPAVLTGDDGRFRIELDPPLAYQFVLTASLQGYGTVSWRWPTIEPNRPLDVGDTTLVHSGDLLVRIVDAEGQVLPTAGWRVLGRSLDEELLEGRDRTRAEAFFPQPDGRFRLRGLPPGRAELTAYSKMTNWIDGPALELVAGPVLEIEIRYTGPDIAARITVSTHTRPFHTMNSDLDSIRLLKDGVVVAEAQWIEGSSRSYSFQDLAPGAYTVEIEDRRFEPWSLSGIEPGTPVDADLHGNAALRLRVTDERNGEELSRYALITRIDRSRWSPRRFGLKTTDEPVPPEGLFDELIPVPQTLLLSAPGYADQEVALPDFSPDETRVLEVSMLARTN